MSIGKILLIEDDESLGATIAENLTLEGHSVDWIKDGQMGLEAAKKSIHDLVVLDIMLPRMNGLEVLENLRLSSSIPVLIISAKGTPQDRIAGLELRADDYLPKPFHLRELLLRVQGLLRRKTTNRLEETAQTSVHLGAATFDFSLMSVHVQGGPTETLTEKEARLLQLLLSKANTVVNRKEILDLVWGYNSFPTTRTIDNVIVRLRKWIELNPSQPEWIISHRGLGYCLRIPVSDKKPETK